MKPIYRNDDRVTKDDRAAETANLFLEVALRNRAPEGPAATGYCLNCEEPLIFDTTGKQRWCDAACRDEWERRAARQIGE